MSAINYNQAHSPASGNHYSHLKIVLFEKTDVQTQRVKIVITTGGDCRSATWINYLITR